MVEQMTFEEILVTDPTTLDEDDDRLAGQNLECYELFMLHGSLTTRELWAKFTDYRGRVRDLRAYMKEKGQTIVCVRRKGGNNLYKVTKI